MAVLQLRNWVLAENFLREKRVTSQLKGHAHEIQVCQLVGLLFFYGPVHQTLQGVQKKQGGKGRKQEQGANLVCEGFTTIIDLT